ncbi:MAG: ribosome maturation factor RimM [Dehalococcoidia bacterium]
MSESTEPVPAEEPRAAPRGPRRKRPLAPPQQPLVDAVSVKDAPRPGFTAVGIVQRPHGIRGEIRATAFAHDAPNLQAGRTVCLQSISRRILRARPSKGVWILQLAGLGRREEVEGLYGELLEARDADVRRADPESYFVHELVGLRVETVDGEDLGTLVEVLETGANDVYIVQGPRGEVLIPAIGSVVASIDLPVGVMRITPLAGLLDEAK